MNKVFAIEVQLNDIKEKFNYLLSDEVQIDEDLERELLIKNQRAILKNAWVNSIRAQVKALWRYQGAKVGWLAEVYVHQDRDGNVKAVDTLKTNVVDSYAKQFKDSIERAIYKASPLPAAPDESVFDEEIKFIFIVN